VTQALFYDAKLGLSWLAWDVILVLVTAGVLRRGPLRVPALFTACTCVAFGAAIVVRRSAFTTVIALPGNVAALLVLPVLVAEDVGVAALSTLGTRILGYFTRAPLAMVDTALLPRSAASSLDARGRTVLRRLGAGALLGLPAAAIFGLLLTADPTFAAVVRGAWDRLDTTASFGACALVTAVPFALAHAIFARTNVAQAESIEPPVTSARSSAIATPYRGDGPAPIEDPLAAPAIVLGPRVSPLTWSVVLGQVALVFAIFVGVHGRTAFGGHSLVQSATGLTYSRYLHAGFYELLVATALSVCLVLAGHALLRPRGGDRAAPVPGGPALAALEATLLVLTGLVLVSCVQRLRIYEEAYGATHLRLGVAFVSLAVALVLGCSVVKALHRGFRGFTFAALASVAVCAVAASFFGADAYVARVNMERARNGLPLDEAYLSSLTADACGALDDPALGKTDELRARLAAAWASREELGDVRSIRGMNSCSAVVSR
jgi:hypothetical protein